MNAAFSPRNLLDFEAHMDPHITSLVKRLQKYAVKSEVFDFQLWGKYLLHIIRRIRMIKIYSELPGFRHHG
jgi:hypothetical protein